ncbi:PREDICTED: TSL-kinase interacting protein 1 [Fragaria vesca subsp. vesca]|uniref:TSL-kinase interacting protein 1 n=1 Tax=Fragaria vesca subsp. vesca TaxID=101020 RepID=UPI0002C2F489|nr:PREDICTED: TSL-kinase interacting protein 1 [Fragaria vesca subsp. vesca]
MKAPRQRNSKVIKVPIKGRASKGSMGEQKSTRGTTQHCQREPGKDDNEKDKHLSPCKAAKGLDLELSDVQFPEPTEKLRVYGIHGGKPLLPHSKIKLQLFPVNEGIRIGLVKDGFHPYLELTLRARKKISSVLNHLISKWGSSSAALGELVLFPYRIQDSVSSNRRWTLNDGDICAGDVYAAIGSPEVFRLRYGWFSNQHKSSDKPSTSVNDKVDLQSKGIKRDTSTPAENAYEVDGKHVVVDTETNLSIGGLLSEASLQARCNNGNKNHREKAKTPHPLDKKSDSKSFELWSDCPSISIGGILSEVSLQGKVNRFVAQSNVSNPSLQPGHSKYDSPQGTRQSTHDPCLSILDAEETCHAFPSQKLSLGKDVLGFDGSCGGSSQNSGFKLFKFPLPAKANRLDELPQDPAQQESNTERMNFSYMNNDERSLGLSGIKWTDSLGPFDLGLPVSQKLCNAESTSISGFAK